jgi:uncharacterized protein
MSKKQAYPLMPKAVAVWLVDNTPLTFKQIADFTGFHELEVKGIADGEVATGITGVDPVTSGQLDKNELERCVKDPNAKLELKRSATYEALSSKPKKGAKYTMIARRQDKPDAIYWLLKNFPNIKDSTIVKLIGTTKTTISAIRDRTHWNMQNIRRRDPVFLGICSQVDLDHIIEKEGLHTAEELNNPVKTKEENTED